MLEGGYIALTILMIILVILGYYLTLKRQHIKGSPLLKKMGMLIGAIVLWIVYTILLNHSGILLDRILPPKFFILMVVPFFVGTVIFYQRNKQNPIILAIPSRWLIYIQSFRIGVELLLLYTFMEGFIPKSATFEGLNFDILMGISAPFVAYFVYPKNGVRKTLAKAWNILGILMVLFVAFIIGSSFYFPNIWGASETLVHDQFFSLPYLFVAGFLAPLAIFIHFVALLQLNHKNEI